jgi:hypothetical protein
MEILKIKSNTVNRYGMVVYRRSNQRFVDFHFGKITWMVAFFKVAK